MFDNLSCLFKNFPIDLFLMLSLPLLLLWWWLNRTIERYKRFSSKLEERIEYLEIELDECRQKEANTEIRSTIKGVNKASNTPAILGIIRSQVQSQTTLTGSATSISASPDDLTIVEGIGHKIESILHKSGIFTFRDLASTSHTQLREILDKAGTHFQVHDPSTWSEQAALARDGRLVELKKWQEQLHGGKR